MEDSDDIFRLQTDENVNKYYGGPRAKSPEHARMYIKKIANGISNNEWVYWAICLKNQHKFAGTICLWNIEKEEAKAEIGYELLPDFQGQGIMQEAMEKTIEFGFEIMRLKKIEAWTLAENLSSIKILEKNHFKRDADAESKIDWGQEPASTVIYTLLNECDGYQGR